MLEPNTNIGHLVLLETSGNQAYIYGTNRLRDIIGASELVHRAGTKYVLEALEETTGEDGAAAEVIVATSGKALLLFRKPETAMKFITAWNRRIVCEAPGLDAFGVIAPTPVDLSKPLNAPDSIASGVREAHRTYEAYRNRRPSPEARFQRLPFAEACRESRLPANTLKHKTRDQRSEAQPASLSRAMKIDARDSGEIRARWTNLHGGLDEWFRDPDKMEQHFGELAWFGVVHADGNGLGQIFLNFENYVDEAAGLSPGRAYINTYRAFSLQIDKLSQEAFRAAAGVVHASKGVTVPVVPIVVGGDDLTVLLDGEQAIAFAKRYVEQFCALTQNAGGAMESVLGKVRALECKRLGACAGISITKPHFPFSVSYGLAGELTASAKQAKRELSTAAAAALDFHILYDSSAGDLGPIRERYDYNGLGLTSKPYVLSAPGKEEEPWFKQHAFRRLENALEVLRKKNEDGRLRLSSTQAHAVRERMFLEERDTQETFWKHALAKTILTDEWKSTSPGQDAETLFVDGHGGVEPSTVFLDALEAREFMNEAPANAAPAAQGAGEAEHANA